MPLIQAKRYGLLIHLKQQEGENGQLAPFILHHKPSFHEGFNIPPELPIVK
jgi:hypothetical protein